MDINGRIAVVTGGGGGIRAAVDASEASLV